MDNLNNYIRLASNAVEQLIQAGAEKAECTLNVDDLEEIQAEGYRFNLMRTMTTESLTLRCIKDMKSGGVTINRLDEESLKDAVQRSMQVAAYASQDPDDDVAPFIENKDFTRGPLKGEVQKLAKRLVELIEDIKREYPYISYELTGSYIHSCEIYVNSNGVRLTDENGSYVVSTGFTAVKDGKTTSFGPGTYFKFLDPDVRYIECQNMRQELDKAMKLLNPMPIGEKFVGTLLATPGFTQEFFSFLSGIALTDSNVISKTSRLRGSLGKQVADKSISFGCMPYNQDIINGRRFTRDGYIEKDLSILDEGVLKDFQLTQHGSKKSGLPNSMNSGQSMCIRPGDKSLDEIISTIDKGVIIGRYSGTDPNVDGEISGVVKNGFLIEKGRIVAPLIETMVSGNIFDMLMNVRGVSKECRKNGIGVFPWIAFDNVTIK